MLIQTGELHTYTEIFTDSLTKKRLPLRNVNFPLVHEHSLLKE